MSYSARLPWSCRNKWCHDPTCPPMPSIGEVEGPKRSTLEKIPPGWRWTMCYCEAQFRLQPKHETGNWSCGNRMCERVRPTAQSILVGHTKSSEGCPKGFEPDQHNPGLFHRIRKAD